MPKKHYIIYIGRFQPFHLGHMYIVEKALEISDKLIILCGTIKNRALATKDQIEKNPLNFNEVKMLIDANLKDKYEDRYDVLKIIDYKTDKEWYKNVQKIVSNFISDKKVEISIIGHLKNSSSEYINHFKDWNIILLDNYHNINATDIRNIFARDYDLKFEELKHLISYEVFEFFCKKRKLYSVNFKN